MASLTSNSPNFEQSIANDKNAVEKELHILVQKT